MIDDDFFETLTEGSPIRPDGRPCMMAFAVKAIELYQILDDILVNLYLTPTKDEELDRKLNQILEFDGRIHAWNKSLPEHLRIQSATRNDPILLRQATVLRIR